ncbi:MAG: HNH endonuclease signature motif containing protein [Longicatena sp.]
MRKILFKKILSILDSIEIQGIQEDVAPTKIYEALQRDSFVLKLVEVKDFVDYIKKKQVLKITINGVDLSPAATIYSKSNQNSGVEALAIFESFIHDSQIFTYYLKQINNNEFTNKKEVLEYIDFKSLQFMLQTSLFEISDEHIRFQPKLLNRIRDICKEFQDVNPLISCALTALYSSSIVAHEDLRIDYRNTRLSMIEYAQKKTILSIIPRCGIPRDRDETKALQSFYKNTLFHEFNHACPLCQINIAHMLIASHIKPFRDCAHIYEAIDHDNGLLLCRNHDYLFDQGYFTFDENGYIIIHKDLLDSPYLKDSYVLSKNFQLPKQYLSENRKLFLAYHRAFIYKQ